jgi:hypothetical protein
MSTARFEPAIPASKRLQTHALDRVATGIGHLLYCFIFSYFSFLHQQHYSLQTPKIPCIALILKGIICHCNSRRNESWN